MKKSSNILILIRIVILSQLVTILSANDNTEVVNTYFKSKSGATINILESSQIVIKSNLLLESDIIGKGRVVMNAEQSSFIDAKKHKIQNLVIASSEKVELFSDLRVVQSLEIIQADLALNDYLLIVNEFTNISLSSLKRIINSGTGRLIIKNKQYLPIAVTPPLTNPINYLFSDRIVLSTLNRSYIPIKNNFFYSTTLQDRAIKISVPPPQYLS